MLFRLIFILILTSIIPAASGQTIIDVGETAPAHNMILLIVDGMGSSYVCPGGTAYTLDGKTIRQADHPVMREIISQGMLIPNIEVPAPRTGPAHSVIITGYSMAEQEMVEYPGSTIYDILDREGFLSIGIMHKGDFFQLRNKQDIILFSESNSITDPSLKILVNGPVPAGIASILESWEQKLPEYLTKIQGLDSYIAYEAWELNATRDIVMFMARAHPDTRYILTLNVGAVDSAGHYRGPDGYIGSIEGLFINLEPLSSLARESNTAFIITADHGMAFRSPDSARGGHASDEYYSHEAIMVPLIIFSPNVEPGTMNQKFQQEDVAPTLLSILDIHDRPKYADGITIPVKDYANLWVSLDVRSDVNILQGTEIISSGNGDNSYIFTGLKPEDKYIVEVSRGDGIYEQTVNLDMDRLVRFETTLSTVDDRGWGLQREQVASAMIFLVIIAGVLAIIRIKNN